MMNFVYALCSSTPGQIQYGGFKRALAKKSGDMIRDQVRIHYFYDVSTDVGSFFVLFTQACKMEATKQKKGMCYAIIVCRFRYFL